MIVVLLAGDTVGMLAVDETKKVSELLNEFNIDN